MYPASTQSAATVVRTTDLLAFSTSSISIHVKHAGHLHRNGSVRSEYGVNGVGRGGTVGRTKTEKNGEFFASR